MWPQFYRVPKDAIMFSNFKAQCLAETSPLCWKYQFTDLQILTFAKLNVAWLKLENDLNWIEYNERKDEQKISFYFNTSGAIVGQLKFTNKPNLGIKMLTLSIVLSGYLPLQVWTSLFWKSSTDGFSCKDIIYYYRQDYYSQQSHLCPSFNYYLHVDNSQTYTRPFLWATNQYSKSISKVLLIVDYFSKRCQIYQLLSISTNTTPVQVTIILP